MRRSDGARRLWANLIHPDATDCEKIVKSYRVSLSRVTRLALRNSGCCCNEMTETPHEC